MRSGVHETLQSVPLQERFETALRQLGPKFVRKDFRVDWTEENPIYGACYPAAEVDWHYLAPAGSKPYRMSTTEGTHWYVVDPQGNVRDFTAKQRKEPFDYSQGKWAAFLTQQPSKRAKILAETMGIV